MATNKYQVVEVTSDLSGEKGATTLRYSIGDTKYEVDLTEEEAGEFHEAFAPYQAVSRVKGGQRGKRGSAAQSKRAKAEEAHKVREWAKENGHEVPATGRIPAAVRKAYDEAHEPAAV